MGKFRPNPTLAGPSSDVIVFIALTKLEKGNGMFSFIKKPEDTSIAQSKWKEEEVVIEPGEGVLWRRDCGRRSGVGHGGAMLVIWYK